MDSLVPLVLRASALVVVAVLVAAWEARVVLTSRTVVGSPSDDRPCEAETARHRRVETIVGECSIWDRMGFARIDLVS